MLRMKCFVLALIVVMMGHASAQTLVQKLYIMRAETTTIEGNAGMTRTCVAVFPDGRYRMERTYGALRGQNADSQHVQLLNDSSSPWCGFNAL